MCCLSKVFKTFWEFPFDHNFNINLFTFIQLLYSKLGTVRDSVDNTVRTPASSSKSKCAGCCQQGHVGNKTLHRQNPPVLNWRCWLTQVDLYNGDKMVLVVVQLLYSRCSLLLYCFFCYQQQQNPMLACLFAVLQYSAAGVQFLPVVQQC